MLRRCCVYLATLSALVASGSTRTRAAPTIDRLSVYAFRIGDTTAVTVTGRELLPQPRLVLPQGIVRQRVRPGAQPDSLVIEATLDQTATPGIHPLRLATTHGISQPVAVAVISRSLKEPRGCIAANCAGFIPTPSACAVSGAGQSFAKPFGRLGVSASGGLISATRACEFNST